MGAHQYLPTIMEGIAPMAIRNERIAEMDSEENKSVLTKLRNRLLYKVQQAEIQRIEIKQLRKLITELEKETRK